jgi:hypothetical protein
MYACGNSYSESQVITVQDTTAPEIQGCPADTSINICSEPIPEAPTLNVADNCDVDFTVEAGITRTWTATDRCGNEAEPCIQRISFTPACGGA